MALMDMEMHAVAKKKPEADPDAMGPVIFQNLERLGYVEKVAKAAEIARLVKAAGGSMSRQRVGQILNAVKVTPETVEMLAKALGVKPSDLTRKPKP